MPCRQLEDIGCARSFGKSEKTVGGLGCAMHLKIVPVWRIRTWRQFEQKLTKNIDGSLRQVNALCLEEEGAWHLSEVDNARSKEVGVG